MKLLKKAAVYSISRKSFGKIFDIACGSKISRVFIRPYIRFYNINPEEIRHPSQYKSLTDFFTRDIRPSLRPIDHEEHSVVSPVDGKIVDLGYAHEDRVILAKNNSYSITELLAEHRADEFKGGFYLNIYLSPKNYHRIHMPLGARVIQHKMIPGKVFPVNNLGVTTIKDLFAKNKRTSTIFETLAGTKFALLKVGALGVGKIVSTYAEEQWINKGMEIGRFEFGSTVILIFQKNTFVPHERLVPNTEVKMGERLGIMKS